MSAAIPLSGSIGPNGPFAILGFSLPIITGNADHVLTVSEYSSTSLKVTSDGTSTAIRSVIAPLAPGMLFLVENLTSEGFAITVKGASGAAVTIPSGATLLVACPDGANYVAPGGGAGASTIVANAAALTALPASGLPNGTQAVVQTYGALFTLGAAGPTLTPSTILAASDGRVWQRGLSLYAPQAQAQTDYYWDSISGSDENTGAVGSPFLNANEVIRRWGTASPELLQSFTLHQLNASTEYAFFSPKMGPGAQALLLGTLVVFAAAFTAGTVTPALYASVTPNDLTIAAMPAGMAPGMIVQNTTRGSYAMAATVSGTTVTLATPYTTASFSPPASGSPGTIADTAWATGNTLVVYNVPSASSVVWRPKCGSASAGRLSLGWMQWTGITAPDAANSEYPHVNDGLFGFAGCAVLSRIHIAALSGRGNGCQFLGCSFSNQTVPFSGLADFFGCSWLIAFPNAGGVANVNLTNCTLAGLSSVNQNMGLAGVYFRGGAVFGANSIIAVVMVGVVTCGANALSLGSGTIFRSPVLPFVGNFFVGGSITFNGVSANGLTPPNAGTFTLNGVTQVDVAPASGHFPANAPIGLALTTVGGTPGVGAPYFSAAQAPDAFHVKSLTVAANDVYTWTAGAAPVALSAANIDLYGSLAAAVSGARFCRDL